MIGKTENLLKLFLFLFLVASSINATSLPPIEPIELPSQGKKASLTTSSNSLPSGALNRDSSKPRYEIMSSLIFSCGEYYIVPEPSEVKHSLLKTASTILPEINTKQISKYSSKIPSSVLSEIDKKPISISFGGSGFYVFYYFGIVDYLQQNYDFSSDNFCFLGASGGALPAKILALDLDLVKYWENVIFKTCKKLASRLLGAFSVFYSETIDKILETMPEESYKVTRNGRLKLSVTVVEKWRFRNKLVSEFKSNKHVVDTGYASAQIPGYSHPSIFFRLKTDEGIKYCLDGGITNNQPIIDDKTIIVNPYLWTDLSIWGCLRQTICLKEVADRVKRGYEDAKAHPEHWKLLESYRRKELRGNSLFEHLNRGVSLQSKL